MIIPSITLSNTPSITYGTTLGKSPLNATATDSNGNVVPGSFTYSCNANTVLCAGTNQVLPILFTPNDTINYTSVVTTALLDVTPATLRITASDVSKVYGDPNPATYTYVMVVLVTGDSVSVSIITPARKFRILPYTNPTRQRGECLEALAGASGSSRRTATLVTPSARPVVSAAVLLELARWCQQRLALMEDGNQCVDAQLDPPRPPFCAPGHDCQGPGHPQLATVGPQHPGGPAFPADPDDRAPRPKVVRKRRKEGSR